VGKTNAFGKSFVRDWGNPGLLKQVNTQLLSWVVMWPQQLHHSKKRGTAMAVDNLGHGESKLRCRNVAKAKLTPWVNRRRPSKRAKKEGKRLLGFRGARPPLGGKTESHASVRRKKLREKKSSGGEVLSRADKRVGQHRSMRKKGRSIRQGL